MILIDYIPKRFRKQAELDNPTGCFNLAILYIKGVGVEQNIEQALSWMRKAAENGDEDAPTHVEKVTSSLGV